VPCRVLVGDDGHPGAGEMRSDAQARLGQKPRADVNVVATAREVDMNGLGHRAFSSTSGLSARAATARSVVLAMENPGRVSTTRSAFA